MKTCVNCNKEIEEGKEIVIDEDTKEVVCSDECLDEFFS